MSEPQKFFTLRLEPIWVLSLVVALLAKGFFMYTDIESIKKENADVRGELDRIHTYLTQQATRGSMQCPTTKN